MNSLFGFLTGIISDRIERGIKEAVSPVAPYLRRLAVGALCIVLSSISFSLALVFVAIALFLKLAGQEVYVHPALWTVLLFAVIGLIIVGIGTSLVRKPR